MPIDNLKKTLRTIFGTRIWSLLRYIVYKDTRRAFTGKFNNYQLAIDKSNTNSNYTDDRLDKIIYQKLTNWKSSSIEDYQYIFATLISLISDKNKKINILEVGGGHNPIYVYVKKLLNKKKFNNINFYVLERESVCKLIKHKERKLKYVHSIKKLKKIDYCFFTSSAQYINEFELLINSIAKLKPEYIGLFKLFTYRGKNDFYSVQTNMRPNKFPVKIFSINNLINLFNIYNYKTIFSNELYVNNDYLLNFKEKIFKTNLVFRKA